jgi:predicted ATPase
VIGREAEVAVLADFLAAGRDTAQALVLDGEAGIGKTTLFDAALAAAREQSYAVFSCNPVGAETAFSFGRSRSLRLLICWTPCCRMGSGGCRFRSAGRFRRPC